MAYSTCYFRANCLLLGLLMFFNALSGIVTMFLFQCCKRVVTTLNAVICLLLRASAVAADGRAHFSWQWSSRCIICSTAVCSSRTNVSIERVNVHGVEQAEDIWVIKCMLPHLKDLTETSSKSSCLARRPLHNCIVCRSSRNILVNL